MSDQKQEKTKQISITISEEQLQLLLKKFPQNKEQEIVETAVEEFFDFLINPKKFSKYSAFQEYRLYLIIKNIFKESFISESDVTKIFKIQSNAAKKMINAVKLDYEDELKTFSMQSMKSILEKIEKKNKEGKYSFECKSQAMIENLNLYLQNNYDSPKKIYKEKESLCTYNIYIDEYNYLIKELSK